MEFSNAGCRGRSVWPEENEWSRNMSKKWKFAAVLMCTSLVFCGCSQGEQGTGTQPDSGDAAETETNENQAMLDVIQPSAYGNVQGLNLEPGTAFSIIGRASSGDYWSTLRAGAEQAVEDINSALGYTGDDRVTLNYSAPEAEDDVDDQVNILDEELDRYPAALGIAAVDAAACEVQFDLAAGNSIPIVAFDSGTNYQNIVSMIETDNQEAARTAAGKLCDNIGDTGEVVLFVHDSSSTSATEREEGFLTEIQEKHPDVSVVRVYHLDDLEEIRQEMTGGTSGDAEGAADETAETAAAAEGTSGDTGEEITQEQAIEYIFQQNPNIKGCMCTSAGVAETVTGVLENMGKENLSVVSFDGGEDQLTRLTEEKLDGLVVQNPYGIGYATVVACARAVLGQGNEAEVNTGYTWVTRDNMEDEEIAKMMY